MARLRPDTGTIEETIAKKHLPCTCGDIYLSRNLVAPDCPFHSTDWEDLMDEYKAHLLATPPDQASAVRLGEDGWVKVEDGELPEHETVLVRFDDTILMGICDSHKRWSIYWINGRKPEEPDRPVTHWRPLPLLPTPPTN